MNKEITIYELLGLIKDGNAPKKIRYEKSEYTYIEINKDYQKRNGELLLGNIIVGYHFNDIVEIIEEDKDIEELYISKNDITYSDGAIKDEELVDSIIEITSKINEIRKEINKLRKEK